MWCRTAQRVACETEVGRGRGARNGTHGGLAATTESYLRLSRVARGGTTSHGHHQHCTAAISAATSTRLTTPFT